MENCNLLAIDIAKNVFQLHGVDKRSKCVMKKCLSRKQFMEMMIQFLTCQIVMEACGSVHYWGRYFQAQGHKVKLVSPQYVKPFVKGNKHDKNDTEVIAEAASRPTMRFVTMKTVKQQDVQSMHRIRERIIQQRTALCKQIRGLLSEYGIVIKQGVHSLTRLLPEVLEDARNEISDFMRAEIQLLNEELQSINKKVEFYNEKLQTLYGNSEVAQRLGKIEGVGCVIATAMLGLGDLRSFKNGRQFSAFLGLVPQECLSWHKQRRFGITKRGNNYLRQLLIHGARSVLLRVKNKQDKKSLWLKDLVARRGINRACCALANKIARVIWVLIS